MGCLKAGLKEHYCYAEQIVPFVVHKCKIRNVTFDFFAMHWYHRVSWPFLYAVPFHTQPPSSCYVSTVSACSTYPSAAAKWDLHGSTHIVQCNSNVGAQRYCTEHRIINSILSRTPSNYFVTWNLYMIKSALQITFIIIGFWVRKHHIIRCISRKSRLTNEIPNMNLKPYCGLKQNLFLWSLMLQHIKLTSWICCVFFNSVLILAQ